MIAKGLYTCRRGSRRKGGKKTVKKEKERKKKNEETLCKIGADEGNHWPECVDPIPIRLKDGEERSNSYGVCIRQSRQ